MKFFMVVFMYVCCMVYFRVLRTYFVAAPDVHLLEGYFLGFSVQPAVPGRVLTNCYVSWSVSSGSVTSDRGQYYVGTRTFRGEFVGKNSLAMISC